jgi:hypothetical protein
MVRSADPGHMTMPLLELAGTILEFDSKIAPCFPNILAISSTRVELPEGGLSFPACHPQVMFMTLPIHR